MEWKKVSVREFRMDSLEWIYKLFLLGMFEDGLVDCSCWIVLGLIHKLFLLETFEDRFTNYTC